MLPRKLISEVVTSALFRRGLVARISQRPISLCNITFNSKREQVEDEIEQNPYFEKYADKIKKVQEDAKQFDFSTQHKGDSRLRRETEHWKQTIQSVEEKLSEKKKEEENRRGSKLPSSLGDLIRLDMLESKSAEEITHIWTHHFKEKDAISAVIPANLYNEMLKRAEEYPTFLYPLPKDQGYEFVLSQFDGNRCFFTSLINFQVHGENAPWQFCITFYAELEASKGVVLMTSELDQSAMNVFEAQCLAQLQKLFYVSPDEKKTELLHTFNKNPDAFKYMDLVKELESSDMIVKNIK